MLYTKAITFTKNGSASSPVRTNFRIANGVIHRIKVYFPPGSAGTTKAWIEHGGAALAPTNADGYYVGDDILHDDQFFYEMPSRVNVISIYGYNESTTEDHEVIVMIGVLPKWALLPVGAAEGIIRALRSIFIDKLRFPKEVIEEEPL